MLARPYEVVLSEGRVEAWSAQRLNFEPKDWRKDLRTDLATSVKTLSANDGQVMHAVYSSAIREACDVENVLTYNVGPGSFANATGAGLRFERAYELPDQLPELEPPPQHHHVYRLTARGEDFACWRRGQTLASWEHVPCPRLTPDIKASAVWLAMRDRELPPPRPLARPPTHFGLALMVHVPHGARFAAAACVKPVVDGTLAAWHAHDGTDAAEVARRLAAQLGVSDVGRLNILLHDASRALLGRRRLLWPWGRAGTSIQWNPADDTCVAGELLIDAASGEEWSFSGELFEVAPRQFNPTAPAASTGGLDI